jgi:DNA ligase 1
MITFKPMLAGAWNPGDPLTFPKLASPKIDGIRAMVIDGVLVSRNLKPIPNKHCQHLFGLKEFNGLDGELVVGDATAPDAFRTTSSGVMSVEGTPAVTFMVFDDFTDPLITFQERLARAGERVNQKRFLTVVPHPFVWDSAQVEEFQVACLSVGWEGIMLRDLHAPYKYGRGTLKAGDLLKVKTFADDEAEVIGLVEQMHNGNAATTDALGRTERSTHKAGKTGKGTLGALVVRGLTGPYKGVEFNIGTGLDDATRAAIWAAKDLHPTPGVFTIGLGSRVTFKYFPGGSKDAPRFPVFKGFRQEGV